MELDFTLEQKAFRDELRGDLVRMRRPASAEALGAERVQLERTTSGEIAAF